MKIKQFYINGEWVTPDGNEEINLINPANEQTVGSVISASKKDVDSAVESANNAFNSASNLSLEDKKQILQEVIDGMSNRRGDFAKVNSEQMGAPLKMSSGAQYGSGVIHFKNTLSVIDDFKFQEKKDKLFESETMKNLFNTFDCRVLDIEKDK